MTVPAAKRRADASERRRRSAAAAREPGGSKSPQEGASTTAGATASSGATVERSAKDLRTLLESELELIRRIVAQTSRRHRLSRDEEDEFSSLVLTKFVEDDYAVLGRYQGRSRLDTYLTVVIVNVLRDWRISRWGKWRPSAMARRLGPDAVALDELITRDGRSQCEAVETLHARGNGLERQQLEEIARRLPRRKQRPRHVPLSAATGIVDRRDRIFPTATEDGARAAWLVAQLRTVLAGLPPEDSRILRMRFREGRKINDIATELGLNAKRLYPRLRRILTRLRLDLAQLSVSAEEVAEMLNSGLLDQSWGVLEASKRS